MKRVTCLTVVVAASLLLLSGQLAQADDSDHFFESKIRPILVDKCFHCHCDTKTSGSLRIDSRELLVKGGESGPAIVPGNPEESLLIKAIRRQADVSAMPPEKDMALRADQVADFVVWIKSGASWPAKTPKFEVAKHWSFEPIRDVAIPVDPEDESVKNSVDSFTRVKQLAAGVRAASVADKLTLIRRATFDLTGLPPTPEEVDAFLQDASPHAFEKVVDRLLLSPRYGERWGRHWLDVVRYADTAGETADYPVPLAWRYRNYVIDAFNSDTPYDEFLTEQIAGDVLAQLTQSASKRLGAPDSTGHSERPRSRRMNSTERYAEQVTATGFVAISRRFGFDSENYHHLTIQDTIDTLGQAVLGLSLGCARCHDHKFDAVSMNDYYALYGIFDSSRYAFPGSEQKKQVRSMLPLIPPSESQPKWREFDARVASIAASLENQKQPVPTAILRSMHDLDGDFEMQAPAAGGSNGVLVPPWLYHGNIEVNAGSQSPFKNLYPRGKVGVNVPVGAGEYRISQALYPRRSPDNCDTLHVNLDFQVASPDAGAKGLHRLWIGTMPATSAVEVLISSESISLRSGETIELLATLKPAQWHNLQLNLDLKGRTVSGKVSDAGSIVEFAGKSLSSAWTSVIDLVVLDSFGEKDTKYPGIWFDNLGAEDAPIAPASMELLPAASEINGLDSDVTKQLDELSGFDGDFELQTNEAAPERPWGPGPNSIVKISASSQSPFLNVFPAGDFGIHMPNRGDYDGFGRPLSNVKPNEYGQLFASFDFRCASGDAGGNGSWRYYLGHGPGNSAAVELFFNSSEFVRRSADARDAVSHLVIGEWYQVQLTLDLKSKTYTGRLASSAMTTDFSGQFASGWDGTIDYTFIDSYGHIGGTRPSLDADNFAISATTLTSFSGPLDEATKADRESRRSKVAKLRQQLASLQSNAESSKRELNALLVQGPFAMTYGMAEGTPHNVRMQIRGEPDRPGVEVPRGFLKVLGSHLLPTDTAGSGRHELAKWLTRIDNPLTARVMVNRIWQYHFGRGLVKTPNDFGVRGTLPTHPELLDHLATKFIQSGWSVKTMHRLIMLSATYQQSSVADATQTPGPTKLNSSDLYVRFSRRRLDAEEIRDAILAVSGELDLTPSQEHPFPTPISWGYSQHGPFSAVYDHNRRSVYLMTQRLKRHPFLALFDGADPNASTAERLGTTVPTQALFFLNDPFVHLKAEKWSMRLMAATLDNTKRIDLAWRGALARLPSEIERNDALNFLATYRAELNSANVENAESQSLAAYLRTLIGSNEFLHVD